jgi:hypothetical protein
MPKKPVTDLITDQEMAYVHLILSGTMNDRRAAEAVGLNPDTAAYTKAKPRVRAYMNDHRAAVREKLVDQEAQGLRQLNLGRDQILARLWELANLSPEATRGSMTGQIKALSMIVAIEGLIPDRRLSPSGTQSAAPPVPPGPPQIYVSKWRRRQKQAEGTEQAEDVTAVEAQPGAPQTPEPEPPPTPAKDAPSPNLDRNQPSVANPFIQPEKLSRVPGAADYTFDTVLHAAGRPQATQLPPKKPLCARPLKSIKSQILSNFMKYPAHITRTRIQGDKGTKGASEGQPARSHRQNLPNRC